MSTVGEMGATCPRGDETECKDSKERGNSGDRVRGPKSPWSSLSLVPLMIFCPVMALRGAQSALWLNTRLLLPGKMIWAGEGQLRTV